MTTATSNEIIIEIEHFTNDRTYRLSFPLGELQNAYACCGWMIWNSIRPKYGHLPEVRAEDARIAKLHSIPIPEGFWFRDHATRIIR